LERRPDFASLEDGVGDETQIREGGPKTDAYGTCPDNRNIKRPHAKKLRGLTPEQFTCSIDQRVK
jgi:hypothetical protein